MKNIYVAIMGSKINKLMTFVLFSLFSIHSYADAICKDGWKSKSEGSGTCSHHGGVAKWLNDGEAGFGGSGLFIVLGIAIVIYLIFKRN